jgi:FixJ family two-component response regulator
MSGLDLQERLRCEGRALPIIFVTAFPNEPARTRALRGGAVCFLIKPFTAADLIDCVQRALLAG